MSNHRAGSIHSLLLLVLMTGAACKTTNGSRPFSAISSAELGGFDPDTIIFASELEFTTDGFTVGYDAVEKYRAKVLELCAQNAAVVNCKQETDKSITIAENVGDVKIRVFPYKDPGVIEIPLDPMTLPQLKKAAPLIQTYVFDATAAIGLTADPKAVPSASDATSVSEEELVREVNRLSAHMNLSWPGIADAKSIDLLMRFFVDYENHPELNMGVMSGDIRNSPPLAIYSNAVRQQMVDLVAAYNKNPQQYADVASMASDLVKKVYTEKYTYSGARYNAINLTHLTTPRGKNDYNAPSSTRLEIRGNYMPKNPAQMIAAYSLIAGRLNYLSTQKAPLDYHAPKIATPVYKTSGMQDGITVDGAIKSYLNYIDGTGLDVHYCAENLINPTFEMAMSSYLQHHPEVSGAQTATDGRDSRDAASPTQSEVSDPGTPDHAREASHGR